jgi:hypothetical protein
MSDWYDPAIKVAALSAGNYVAGYAPRGLLHTTEGSSAAGAISSFRQNNSWPHFTIDADGTVYQHIPIAQAARALRNLVGGVETNKARCIQIEVVGFAARPLEHSPTQLTALKALMRWIEANAGVKPKGPGRAFASAYGQNYLRFTGNEWKIFDGWCGHCHCPENDHWDPGLIDLQSLLPTPGVKPMFDPPIGPFAAAWLDENGRVISEITPDGQVYFGKWYGNVAGKPYWGTRKAALIGPRPDGNPGYRITATSGEVYDLPDGLDQI